MVLSSSFGKGSTDFLLEKGAKEAASPWPSEKITKSDPRSSLGVPPHIKFNLALA